MSRLETHHSHAESMLVVDLVEGFEDVGQVLVGVAAEQEEEVVYALLGAPLQDFDEA